MLGIDVSKDSLVCALLEPATRRFAWEATLPNTAEGVAELLRRAPAGAPWVLEPTGRHGERVARQAAAKGRRVLMAQPRRARDFLRALGGGRAKTDRLDSRGLALYGAGAELRPYPVRSAAVEEVEQLLSARKGISRSLASLKQQRRELPHAREALDAAIEALERQVAALDERIAGRARASEEFEAAARLDEVPGVGPVVAAAVAARLRALPFARADQFVAYVGLDVRVRESGRFKGRRKLSKQGDAELRRLLYLAAQANLRCEASPFKDRIARDLERGLTKTAALCVAARKLARLCWSLVRHGTSYDPERVYADLKHYRPAGAQA
jgi:transposase